MSKRLNKILEIIGILAIFLIIYHLFGFVQVIIHFLLKIILPFIIGFSLAFILEPIVNFLEKHKIKRKMGIILIVGMFVFLLFLVIKWAVPLFIKQLGMFLEMLPSYFTKLQTLITKFSNKFMPNSSLITIDYEQITGQVMAKLTALMSKITTNIQGSFSYILQFLITPVLAIYFLNDYDKIENFVKQKLGNHHLDKLYLTLGEIKKALRSYLKGEFLVVFILMLMASFSFLVIGLDYAFLFGIIIGITDIIPYVGPYIGGAIVVVFTMVSHPEKVIIVLILIVIFQFIEGNFLTPKVQSKALHTHPILVLLAVSFFGEIMGILGIMIAVPLEKIIEILVKNFVLEHIKKA